MAQVVERRVELHAAQVIELEEEPVRHVVADERFVVARRDEKRVNAAAELLA